MRIPDTFDQVINKDGTVYYYASFLPQNDATALFEQLYEELDWQQETLMIMGKPCATPRLVSWYGNSGLAYTYSGKRHLAQSWTANTLRLKQELKNVLQLDFNSVLGNLYRDGQDSMGWHADKEKELGANPVIASLSLGAERRFKMQHQATKTTIDLSLQHGSLLVMAGSFQHHWRHCLPKTSRNIGARINLTFRNIQASRKMLAESSITPGDNA